MAEGNMTAKEYLQQAYFLDQKIEYGLQRLEELQSRMEKLQRFSSIEHIGTNPNRRITAPFEDTIDEIIRCEETLCEQVCESIKLKREIERQIDAMGNPKERLVLKQRYLLMKGWRMISNEFGIPIATVYRLHKNGLLEFRVPGSDEVGEKEESGSDPDLECLITNN